MSCKQCEKPFQRKAKNQKYCKQECYWKSKVGKKHWWGYKIGEAPRKAPLTEKRLNHLKELWKGNTGKPRPDMTGENAPWWLGDKVGYDGIHDWVRAQLEHPKTCEHCGRIGKKSKGRWDIHWANVSGDYLRDVADWIGLCRRCHYYYDANGKEHGRFKEFPDGKHRLAA